MVKINDDYRNYAHEIASRMDFLERIPLSNMALVAISLASFFTYYDLTNFSYISPTIKVIWNLQDTQIALAASMTIFGYVIGSFTISFLSDYSGRKLALVTSILILSLGSLASSFSSNITQMAIFRLVTGIGIGAEIAVVAVYVAEISPKSKRGRYISLVMILGWIGITSSGPASFYLIAQNQVFGIESWRVVAGLGGLIAFIILPFRIKIPESPRWLVSKGNLIEANSVLRSFGLAPLDRISVSGYLLSANRYRFKNFWNRNILFRVILLTAIWFLVLLPIYASLLLVIEFVNQGFSLSESISINTLGSFGFVAGGLLSIFASDRIERKFQVAIASSIMGFAFIMRGLLIHDYVGLVIAGFLAFAFNAWLITSLISYTAENFPTRIRSTGVGIIEGAGRGLAAIGPMIFVSLQPLGFELSMIIMALFAFAASIIVILYGSRTLNRSLEELSRH
jgi:putative MFS transporter